MYHISETYLGEVAEFSPRVPESALHGEDKVVPRVCVCPTPYHCIVAVHGRPVQSSLWRSAGKTYYVYKAPESVETMEAWLVPDHNRTLEKWILESTTMSLVGELKIDSEGHIVEFNDQSFDVTEIRRIIYGEDRSS